MSKYEGVEHISLLMASEIFSYSYSYLGNLRAQDPKFPAPVNETGVRMYRIEDVQQYLAHRKKVRAHRNELVAVRLNTKQRDYCLSRGKNLSDGLRNIINDDMKGHDNV